MGITIIEDTRQQSGKHNIKHEWWGRESVSIVRCKLAWGDYCLPPVIAVDTKNSIAELAMDIDQQHKRFRAECIGAKDAGCQLVVLVENTCGVQSLADLAAWNESAEQFSKRKNAVRRLEGGRLAKACVTMSERYGVMFDFCSPDESAKRVVEILTKKESRNG